MDDLDPRLNAIRGDLADARLADFASGARLAEGSLRQVTVPILNIHREPRFDARQVTQALLGEYLRVFDAREGWAWVQLENDGYVGYASEDGLTADIAGPTHRVAVNSTLLFPQPDIKSQPPVTVTLNAALHVAGIDGAFARLANSRFAIAVHLAAADEAEDDYVAVAQRFLHVPYLWGGKSVLGLDCSGLVQLSLEACALPCPRDTDMQEAALGEAVEGDLRRGDFVFWKGHVGIMLDEKRLLHANGHHMLTVIEPLDEAVARIAAKGSDVTGVRRL